MDVSFYLLMGRRERVEISVVAVSLRKLSIGEREGERFRQDDK